MGAEGLTYLLAEIQFKGAISDFSVVKKQISDYDGDQLLIVLDDDEIYGQNFYMCYKPEEAARVVAEEDEKAAARGGGKKKAASGPAPPAIPRRLSTSTLCDGSDILSLFRDARACRCGSARTVLASTGWNVRSTMRVPVSAKVVIITPMHIRSTHGCANSFALH